MRVLRPLRFIAKWENLKAAVVSLLKSVGDIGSTMFVIVVLVFLMAIPGVAFFKGKFMICVDISEDNE